MAELAERKISTQSFFNNSPVYVNGGEEEQSRQLSESAFETAQTALVQSQSNQNYLQSLLQTISTQSTEIQQINGEVVRVERESDSQEQELAKAISFLNSSFLSLSAGLQSLRTDVEGISRYLLDEQKQRQQQIVAREKLVAAKKDVQEKTDILKSLRKSVSGGAKGAFQFGQTGRPQGEESFFQKLVQGAAAATGIAVGTAVSNDDEITQSSEGNATQQSIYNYLINDKGLSKEHALGIMANIKAESGFRTNAKSGDDGGAGGLFQWKKPRSTRMAATVNDWEKNWKGQIDYALKEDAGPSYLNQSFKSAEDAARWWMLKWERPRESLSRPGGPRDKEHNAWIKSFKPAEQTAKPETKPAIKPKPSSASRSPVGTPQAADVKPDQTSMKPPSGDASAPFVGAVASTQVKPEVPQKSVAELTPPSSSSSVATLPPIMQGSQGGTNTEAVPDFPSGSEIATNNPLTRLWTINSINHLNINASMPHIYG
jgi:hypothetical protein